VRIPKASTAWFAPVVLTALPQLAGAVAVPLIHAQVEVFQSAREFEATHSELCSRIHAEATCVVRSSFQLTPAAGATASARPAENPAAGSAAGR
jgi:hypothetical protein